MLRPQGYAVIIDDRPVEADTITCGHCNIVVQVKPGTGSTVYIIPRMFVDPITKQYSITTKEVEGAFCRCCMHHVCPKCDNVGTCTPFLRRIEEIEARERMLKAILP
jgi:hypothetical protein